LEFQAVAEKTATNFRWRLLFMPHPLKVKVKVNVDLYSASSWTHL